MPNLKKNRLRKAERFIVPKVCATPGDPDYRLAWEGAPTIDCNLILEGGAMRGQFTAGVLDFFMDNALLPKLAIGVSAGALNGFNYRAGLRGRSCYLNTKYCTDWRYLSMRSFALTGNAFNAEYVFDRIPNELEPFNYDAYARSPIDLITVSSDIVRGAADYCALKDARTQIEYLRASAAIPLLSRPAEIDGKKLLDGGICDSIPLEYSRSTGTERHVIVLTQHSGYIKPPNRMMPLVRHVYANYPAFVKRMEHRYIDYNRSYAQVAELEKTGEIFVIRPAEPITVASMEHDPKKLYELYLTGYEEAKKHFKALQNYLAL